MNSIDSMSSLQAVACRHAANRRTANPSPDRDPPRPRTHSGAWCLPGANGCAVEENGGSNRCNAQCPTSWLTWRADAGDDAPLLEVSWRRGSKAALGIMMALPTDRKILRCIFKMYESSYPGKEPGDVRGKNDPHLPIKVHDVATRLGCSPEMLFGRLYYHGSFRGINHCAGHNRKMKAMCRCPTRSSSGQLRRRLALRYAGRQCLWN